MNRTARWIAAVLCAAGLVQAAEAGFSIGGKLWYMQFGDETIDDAGVLGPKGEYSNGRFWVSGMWLIGESTRHYVGYADDTFDLQDAEIVAGWSFPYVDVGAGIRRTTWVLKDTGGAYTKDYSMFGPMVYVGGGSSFGNSPIGWYAGGSLMFLDLGDLDDNLMSDGSEADTGEHFNIEAGVSYSAKHCQFTLGYRVKRFLKYDGGDGKNDWTQSGPVFGGVYIF